MIKPFFCLAAIWNHKQEWTENLVQLFLNQDYPSKRLILLDDRPQGLISSDFESLSDVVLYRTTVKFPCLPCKYDEGVTQAGGYGLGDEDKVFVCVMDDDDLYLPHFLSDHARVLENYAWSYPNVVFSTYGRKLNIEQSGGRFWASSAYRLSSLEAIGGYGDSKNMAYDQGFLDRMRRKFGEPGRPARPGYVYNWDMTNDVHVSAEGGETESAWYDNSRPSIPKYPFVPKLNETTKWALEQTKNHPLCK
jgi:hypothetical protein